MMPNFNIVPNISTAWVDREKAPKGQKRNPPAMVASHCPFCGKPVEKRKASNNRVKRSKPRSCNKCGCTENNACKTKHGPCGWSNIKPAICTACE